MWASWAALFGQQTATITDTTAHIHEPGLFAARWEIPTPDGTHRLSCSHIHDSRRKAEDCGRNLNAQVERMLREQRPIDHNYVAIRLYRNPGHQYLGVYQEEDIL